jgi:hypothetical protein
MSVAKDGNRPARRSGDGVAADDDVRMEAAMDVATGGAGSLPTPILGMTAADPSARVRPRVTDGGGGKAGNHDDGTGEGAEQATLSTCGERTATDEVGGYEFRTHRSGTSYGGGERWCRVLTHTDPRYDGSRPERPRET